MREQTFGHIFETIENIEQEIALLKLLVQQAVSDDATGGDILVDDVAYLGGSTDQDSILVDAAIIVEADNRPRAQSSRRAQRLDARRRAQAWAASEQEKKRAYQANRDTHDNAR
jgi:hypothetical protein